MKGGQFKELLLRSVTDELELEERLLMEAELLPDYVFTPGFKERVLSRIDAVITPLYMRPDFLRSFEIGFRRVALTGVAAILVLAVSLLLTQGSLSYDTLLGIDNQVDDSLISLLIE
ncbi:MAG: hypothetical protein E4G95_06515 [Bacteroidia bacterium]|nr:MAG: hypothetical protein E4G95_06515 [Bacteroidia bacterium]